MCLFVSIFEDEVYFSPLKEALARSIKNIERVRLNS